MTGTPTRSPGEGGWIHTQPKRLPPKRRAKAADPGHGRPYGRHGAAVAAAVAATGTAPECSRIPAERGSGLAGVAQAVSASTDEGGSQVLIDGGLGYPEAASNADRFQFAGVH